MSRFTVATGMLVLATAALTSCTSAEEPEPTWTEESAYAAAEETFRAYWAAGAEGSAARAPYLNDEMKQVERDGENELADLEIETRGASTVESVQLTDFRLVDNVGVVELEACIDGVDVEVRQKQGEWRNPRADPIYGVVVRLESSGDMMVISDIGELEEDRC